MENKRQKTEIADIFRIFESEYHRKYHITCQQKKVFNAIVNCRTQAMGGHIMKCNNCGYVQHAYNSCRNRHCPKCQYLKQVVWVDKLKSRLLPVKYFHIVFTVPSSLHGLFFANQRICYDLLMKSASQAILKVGENPSFLGARTGCVAILHTWGQALTYHPHVHMLVPAGGFYKIRYYGIFANTLCYDRLDTWLSMNDKETNIPSLEGKHWQEIVRDIFGYDPFICPECKKGIMLRHADIDAEPRAA